MARHFKQGNVGWLLSFWKYHVMASPHPVTGIGLPKDVAPDRLDLQTSLIYFPNPSAKTNMHVLRL